jgi:hypothetical protein
MKAKEMIDILSKLDSDEQILVAWWTKDTVSGWFSEDDYGVLTNEMWSNIVDEFDDLDLQDVADDITNFAMSELNDKEVDS